MAAAMVGRLSGPPRIAHTIPAILNSFSNTLLLLLISNHTTTSYRTIDGLEAVLLPPFYLDTDLVPGYSDFHAKETPRPNLDAALGGISLASCGM